MGKRKLTGSEKELHKKATAIRKRFGSMNDEALVEMLAETPKGRRYTAGDSIGDNIGIYRATLN